MSALLSVQMESYYRSVSWRPHSRMRNEDLVIFTPLLIISKTVFSYTFFFYNNGELVRKKTSWLRNIQLKPLGKIV